MSTQQKKRTSSHLTFRPVLGAGQSPDLRALLGGVIQELKAIRSLLQESDAREGG